MNIAFRVDASADIATGHFMRCLALADAASRAGARIRFVTCPLPDHLRSMLHERRYPAATLDTSSGRSDREQTAAALDDEHWDWLVVDHYGLDARWETAMRGTADRILVIDDLAGRVHDCDVLLDQNLWSDEAQRYQGKVPTHCQQLIGPAYALLRDEFASARRTAAPRTGPARRVLVSFGGVDSSNWTGVAIEALSSLRARFEAIDVVIGGSHPHRMSIASACETFGFTCHVQSSGVAALMAHADLGVGAGGVSTWERCCVGLPALAIAVAPNQEPVVAESARRGLVYAAREGARTPAMLARHIETLADDQALRETLSRAGMDTVDGRGTARVLAVLDGEAVLIREATSADEAPLLEWRNDETVRRASRNSDRIAPGEHHAWLASVLADTNRLLLIGERGGAPAGVVRFDVTGTQAEVSIYRVRGVAGSGLGGRLLAAAEQWLRHRRPDVTRVTAEVIDWNERSHGLFRSAGYERRGSAYEKTLQRS